MNFAESLTYWYLRLNGFFPLSNFIIHRYDEPDEGAAADIDLLAIRLPYVYERIGGLEADWDTSRFNVWGLDILNKTIGLIVEVKTGKNTRKWRENINLSFEGKRLRCGLQRFGFWSNDDINNNMIARLEENSIYNDGQFGIGKLLVAERFPVRNNEPIISPCCQITLDEIDQFINGRIQTFIEKGSDKLRFPSDMMQYIVWRKRQQRQ